MMRYLWSIYRTRAAWLFANMLLLAFTWISAIGLLAVSGWFIAACAIFGLGLVAGLNLLTPSTIIRALALSRTFGRYAERVVGHEAILRVLKDLRIRVFNSLIQLHPVRTATERHAEMVTRLTEDVERLDAMPLRLIGPALAAGCVTIACLITAAILGGSAIAMVIAGTVALTGIIGVMAASYGERSSQDRVKANAKLRIEVDQHLDSLAELSTLNRLGYEAAQLQSLSLASAHTLRRQEAMASLSEHLVQALTALATLTVWAIGVGELEVAPLCLLTLMTLGLNESLGALPGALWRNAETLESARRLHALETARNQIPAQRIDMANTGAPPTLELKNLFWRSRRYTQRNHSAGLTVTIRAGAPTLVTGASGCGKSSLLSVMAGELAAESGSIYWAGISPLALSTSHRARALAYLAQDDALFDVTIREYFKLAVAHRTQPPDDALLWHCLEVVELDSVFKSIGSGLDYRLGIHGQNVSGGQARRLQLAALLQGDPELILLDEPFKGLEYALAARIIERITPWLMSRGCVIVTHHLDAFPTEWRRIQL